MNKTTQKEQQKAVKDYETIKDDLKLFCELFYPEVYIDPRVEEAMKCIKECRPRVSMDYK